MTRKKGLVITMLITTTALAGLAQTDTAGLSGWTKMYNSTATWEEGAFMAHAMDHPDYGWGIYNSLTHDVVGDSIFIVKLLDGTYKRLWIKKKRSVANRYVFWYSGLDGTQEKRVDLPMNDYADKRFLNYSLSGDSIVDDQPEAGAWDLVLTRFLHPGLGYYTVTGFMANEGVSVSVYHAEDSVSAATATLADTTVFSDSIAAIGNSWYELQGMSIVPLDTMVYFVKQAGGDIYKLQVTWFESGYSGNGRVGIRKQRVSGTPEDDFTHDTLGIGAFYVNDVYFSMGSGMKYPVTRATWEIGFKTTQFSSGIRANTVSGVELYTYPHADTNAWSPAVAVYPAGTDAGGISLYPVPVTERLYLRHRLNTGQPLDIRIYDISGRQVMERPALPSAPGELQLDVSALPAGIYFLELDNAGIRSVRRFTVR